MAREEFSALLTGMIEQAKGVTAEQADALGTAWTSEEGLSYDPASLGAGHTFQREQPHIQNLALQEAWQRVSALASEQGRADELDAAIAAEKAVEHAVRHFDIGAIPKAGAVEAARAAVLAAGVRDIIDSETYDLLIGPWQSALGTP
jgi:hypothetical protein